MGNAATIKNRGTANKGLRKESLTQKQYDEMTASLVNLDGEDLSHYNTGQFGEEKTVKHLIRLAENRWNNFTNEDELRPLTKYRRAESYIKVVDYLEEIARHSPRQPNGVLIEFRVETRPNPNLPGDIIVERQPVPWTSAQPRRVGDIPETSNERLSIAREYILNHNPGLASYDDEQQKAQQVKLKTKKPRKILRFPFRLNPVDVADLEPPPPEKVKVLMVSYKPSTRLREMLAENSGANITEIQVEDVALGIRALCVDPLEIGKAREIARSYLNRYIFSGKEGFKRDYNEIKDLLKNNSTIDLGFTYQAALNLFYDYKINIGKSNLYELVGDLKREMNELFKLDKVDAALKKFFQSFKREDYADVLRKVNYSRSLMISMLQFDFEDLAEKRDSWFFPTYESAFLGSQFPTGDKQFFAYSKEEIMQIYKLIKADKLEEAVDRGEVLFEQFIEFRNRVDSYERDKLEWGSRAIFLMTFIIDVLITYLTAGFTRVIPARAGFILNLALPIVKQELYIQIGVIQKRDFKGIAIDAAISVISMKIATSISNGLMDAYNLPLSSFKTTVIDNLVTNFASALQQEIIAVLRGSSSLDDLLKNILKNFLTGVIHETAARKAIARARVNGLDQAVLKHGASIYYHPGKQLPPPAKTIPGEPLAPTATAPVESVAPQIPSKVNYTTAEPTVYLVHGTDTATVQQIEANGFRFMPDNSANADFGSGVYFATNRELAIIAASRKTSGQKTGMEFTIDGQVLGKVVDIRAGGAHRGAWEQHLSATIDMPPGVKTMITNGELMSRQPEQRTKVFESFLKKNGLEEADTIFAPIGDEYTTGTVMRTDEHNNAIVDTQVVIRNQETLSRFNELFTKGPVRGTKQTIGKETDRAIDAQLTAEGRLDADAERIGATFDQPIPPGTDINTMPSQLFVTSNELKKGNFGERMAAEQLASEGHHIIIYKPDIEGTNQGGIDILTLKDGELYLVDNKALTTGERVQDVSALTTNLEQNVAAMLNELRAVRNEPGITKERLDIINIAIHKLERRSFHRMVTNASFVKNFSDASRGVSSRLSNNGFRFQNMFPARPPRTRRRR